MRAVGMLTQQLRLTQVPIFNCSNLQDEAVLVREAAVDMLGCKVDVSACSHLQSDATGLRLIILLPCLNSQDEAVSVREAAVDLLGRHIGDSAELAGAYLPMLAASARDAGTSVRKRALTILWESCIRYFLQIWM